MKFVSWNVNGLRSCMSKGFKNVFDNLDADIFSIQETKMQQDQIDKNIKEIGDNQFFNDAKKKGYSGTACFTKERPLNIYYGINEFAPNNLKEIDYDFKEDQEGRIITLEFEKFFLVNCYTPNSKRELERLEFRAEWEDNLRNYLVELDKTKPVIYCGDFNVAHEEIDLKNPSTNHKSAGFTDTERNKMSQLLDAGFVDTFRFVYPEKVEYTWWSYMYHAREKNVGWRIDYFIVSNSISEKIIDSKIHTEILGSDHCPIELDIDL